MEHASPAYDLHAIEHRTKRKATANEFERYLARL